MEKIKLNDNQNETQEFLKFLDKLLQKKIDDYNLALLIQCERNIYAADNSIQKKAKEITTIQKEIKEYKVLKNPDNLLSMFFSNPIARNI